MLQRRDRHAPVSARLALTDTSRTSGTSCSQVRQLENASEGSIDDVRRINCYCQRLCTTTAAPPALAGRAPKAARPAEAAIAATVPAVVPRLALLVLLQPC